MKQSPLRTRRRVSITFGESRTEQCHAKRCNISSILNKYKKTGMLTHNSAMQGSYADYPNQLEFHAMQNAIANSKSLFESIPSHIRSKFGNDPGVFLDYISNPDNREEMLEMGFDDLHLPPAEPEPEPATNTSQEPPEDEPETVQAKK